MIIENFRGRLTIYRSDNKQFASLEKIWVEMWDRDGLDVNEMDHATKTHWSLKGKLEWDYK